MATMRTVGWEHDGADYRVTGTYTPGRPGRGPSRDDPGEPPEGADFEVFEVREDRPGGALRPELIPVARESLPLLASAEAAELDAYDDARELDADASREEARP